MSPRRARRRAGRSTRRCVWLSKSCGRSWSASISACRNRPCSTGSGRAARKIIGNATTVAEARALAAHGVDAIIAQGWEAGGHAGRFLGAPPEEQMGLIALVPQIADATGLPVIAAGGIGDARGIAAALMLGAAAVQIGTAYLHCPESLIAPAHREGLAGEAAEHSASPISTAAASPAACRAGSSRSSARSAPKRRLSRWPTSRWRRSASGRCGPARRRGSASRSRPAR